MEYGITYQKEFMKCKYTSREKIKVIVHVHLHTHKQHILYMYSTLMKKLQNVFKTAKNNW